MKRPHLALAVAIAFGIGAMSLAGDNADNPAVSRETVALLGGQITVLVRECAGLCPLAPKEPQRVVAFITKRVKLEPAAEPRQGPPGKARPASHTRRDVEGWTVHVDDRLLAGDDAALGRRALGLLESQLRAVALVLPEDKVKRLRRVPVWLDLSCGELRKPQYHPSADWLAAHGYSRELARAVHVPDAGYFAQARFQREQPWALLHELAHAYHDQVLGFDQAEVRAAWERFVRGGRYKSVLHISGERRPHYGLTDAKEFFAEMTETYFGRNDYFPFNSAELRREEPELFALLAKIWGSLP